VTQQWAIKRFAVNTLQWIAVYRMGLEMLLAERVKYASVVLGLALTTFVLGQQPALLMGILRSTYALVTDTPAAHIWVMERQARYIDDAMPMADTALLSIRSVGGVAWAAGLARGNAKVRLADGKYMDFLVYGLDEVTLMGGPMRFLSGQLNALREVDAIVINEIAVQQSTSYPGAVALKMGDAMELNDRRAVIVGIFRSVNAFNQMPIAYTTASRFRKYVHGNEKILNYILVGLEPGVHAEQVIRRINASDQFLAFSDQDLKNATQDYFIQHTPIVFIFGFSTLLGVVIGIAIAAQSFFGFVRDNLRYFGVLKAIGATALQLRCIAIAQAVTATVLGFGLGAGALAWVASYVGSSMPLELWLLLTVFVTALCLASISAIWAMQKAISLDPSTVFRG
jgi:putative ABC transport system permease protein